MRATEFITEISRERLQSYLSGADQQVGRRLDRMSQARERLNRSYEIYDVNEPTRIIDRFTADTAQQARSYYTDFIQNYSSDVDYEFGLRRGTGLAEGSLNEWQEADLYHVTYIPSMLQMWHNDTMGLGGDVSTTRNYNYALGYLKNFRNSGGVIFTLDQNRLRRDIGRRRMPGTDWFKGEPPADSSDEFRRRDDSLDTDRFETLIKGGLKPFRKYVKKIQIWLPKKRTIKPTPPGEDPLYRHTYTPGDDPDQHYDVSVNDELMQNNWFRNPTMKATWDAVLRDPRTEVKSELGFQKTQHNVPVRARTQYGTDHRLYDLSKDDFREGQENFNGIDISMKIQKDDEYVDDEDYDNQVLYVTASSKGKELGHVLFAFDGEYLMPQDLEVEERYRGQGIAQIMYDYVKSKGYKIRRSGQQTDAGAGFWDKHKPGKNVWEQGVAEDKINPAGLNHTQQIGDYVYRAKALTGSDEGEIEMTAYDGKKSIADTVFMPYGSGGRMISGQTYVHPAYRGKGVAAGMYAYLRMLGFKIEPSGIRTDAGKAMWDKWEKTGDAKYLSKGVAEGQEKFNIALMKPGFRWSEEINGITYLVRTQWDNMPEVIARVNNREVGRATFIDHHTRSGLESVSTYVSPKWQGHGIAKNMYAVIRMLGANIQPSATQTDMGKDMWAKWKKGGDTKHLTSMNAKTDQQGVAENFADGKGPGRPGDSVRHGIPKHATMAELEKASHAKGRKGQLARWQLNMRRGHKK